jgi:hypothetical protein
MSEPPFFLSSPLPLKGEASFEPEIIPFRGGMIAWGATGIVGVTLIIIRLRTGGFQCMTISFFLFLLLAAILITFNYWIDSNTIIRATDSQLMYKTPIREFSHGWDQVSEIRATRVGHSWRVTILGTDSSFSLRIKSENAPEDHRGRILELPKGDELIRIICTKTNLTVCDDVDGTWICSRP